MRQPCSSAYMAKTLNFNAYSVVMDYPNPDNHYQSQHAVLLVDSYRKLLGKPLLTGVNEAETLAEMLFYAPFALLSHNTSPNPVFNYANLSALKLFEYPWDELMLLPSRESAEIIAQSERTRLLMEVQKNGYINHYQGIRKTKSGRQFRIEDACVWNLVDAEGSYRGQAACFQNWLFL
jgi:hypothetical protein